MLHHSLERTGAHRQETPPDYRVPRSTWPRAASRALQRTKSGSSVSVQARCPLKDGTFKRAAFPCFPVLQATKNEPRCWSIGQSVGVQNGEAREENPIQLGVPSAFC